MLFFKLDERIQFFTMLPYLNKYSIMPPLLLACFIFPEAVLSVSSASLSPRGNELFPQLRNCLHSRLREMHSTTFIYVNVIFFILHVEVASFFAPLTSNSVFPHGRAYFNLLMSTNDHDKLDCKKVESPNQEAILSETVMNKRLIELGSEPIDFDLIKKTIAEWSKPLPQKYFSQPIILAGPSGVGKGRLVKALMKDYKKFFAKIVTHTTRG